VNRIINQALSKIYQPVDISSLVAFRVMFGAIMIWEVYLYISRNVIAHDYILPVFNFTYYGFDWVKPWPGAGMYYHFYGMGVLAFFILIGFLYRISAFLFFLAFTYIFLLEQVIYVNHFYFLSLVSLMLIFVPANRAWSVDSILKPSIRSNVVSAWAPGVLAANMGIVYFFGGIAKLSSPDWLRGRPLNEGLSPAFELPVIGSVIETKAGILFFSWSGMLLDLLIVPALIWRKTRIPAFISICLFHLFNAYNFHIGIFPIFSIAITLLFFSPSWPKEVLSFLKRSKRLSSANVRHEASWATLNGWQRAGLWFFSIYFLVQLLVPMRHWFYPGEALWTEEGSRFAWHMMLRHKTGKVKFRLRDKNTGDEWTVYPRIYLSRFQYRQMATRPILIQQFAHYLKEVELKKNRDVEVRAIALARLNGRKPQYLIDKTIDLAAQPRTFLRSDPWIYPLKQPFRSPWP